MFQKESVLDIDTIKLKPARCDGVLYNEHDDIISVFISKILMKKESFFIPRIPFDKT